MYLERLIKIYFSPTHATEKIINAIGKGLGFAKQVTINLNSMSQRHHFNLDVQSGDIVILGVPVYEERIPDLLYPALYKIQGQGQPIILIVTYGNISAGIALKQLKKKMQYQGFNPIAAASFIGEHSFSQKAVKIAPGRPDKQELEKAGLLGKNIYQKIKFIEKIEDIPELEIKGELLPITKILPRHSEILFAHPPFLDTNLCQNCRKCLEICPVNAIDHHTLRSRDKLCIRCFACVKFCPHDARKIIYKKPALVRTVLKKMGKKRKEPEFFI